MPGGDVLDTATAPRCHGGQGTTGSLAETTVTATIRRVPVMRGPDLPGPARCCHDAAAAQTVTTNVGLWPAAAGRPGGRRSRGSESDRRWQPDSLPEHHSDRARAPGPVLRIAGGLPRAGRLVSGARSGSSRHRRGRRCHAAAQSRPGPRPCLSGGQPAAGRSKHPRGRGPGIRPESSSLAHRGSGPKAAIQH